MNQSAAAVEDMEIIDSIHGVNALSSHVSSFVDYGVVICKDRVRVNTGVALDMKLASFVVDPVVDELVSRRIDDVYLGSSLR